jgi:hypothetical protein
VRRCAVAQSHAASGYRPLRVPARCRADPRPSMRQDLASESSLACDVMATRARRAMSRRAASDQKMAKAAGPFIVPRRLLRAEAEQRPDNVAAVRRRGLPQGSAEPRRARSTGQKSLCDAENSTVMKFSRKAVDRGRRWRLYTPQHGAPPPFGEMTRPRSSSSITSVNQPPDLGRRAGFDGSPALP